MCKAARFTRIAGAEKNGERGLCSWGRSLLGDFHGKTGVVGGLKLAPGSF
jgi:hypothetical protein